MDTPTNLQKERQTSKGFKFLKIAKIRYCITWYFYDFNFHEFSILDKFTTS